MSIPNAKKFQPGQSGNPRGGSKKASLKKKLREMGVQDVVDLTTLVLNSPLSKLEEVIQDAGKGGTKSHSALVTLMASVTVRGIAKGDQNALDMLLSRVIGKAPAPVQLSNPDGSLRPQQVFLEFPDNGRRADPEELSPGIDDDNFDESSPA